MSQRHEMGSQIGNVPFSPPPPQRSAVITHILDECEGSQGMHPQTQPSPHHVYYRGDEAESIAIHSVFSAGESHGQRSLAGYSPWSCTELDSTEVTEYACMNPRADPKAKELRMSTEEAGGLEQRET